MSPRWPSLLVLASLSLPVGRAHAWTETRIETVHARVDLDAEANADVQLDIYVYVRAGWLEGFEIAGIDAEPSLAEAPVEVVSVPQDDSSAPPRRFRPSVRLRDDRVSLRFRRAQAPRRGHYRVTLRYRANLAAGAELTEDGRRFRVPWTLPGWHSGLDGVQIELRAPPGADFAPDDDGLTVVARSREIDDTGRSVLRWRRAHLPRTVPWTVAVEVPTERMAPLVSARDEAAHPTTAPVPEVTPAAAMARPPGLGGVVGALLGGLLALGSLLLFEREAARRRATPRPWLPMPRAARYGLVAALTLGAAGCAYRQLAAGCVALLAVAIALVGQRRARRALPGLGRWRPVSRDDLHRAEKECRRRPWALSRWGDLTTAPGTLTLLLATVALGAVHELDLQAGRDVALTPWLWAMLSLPLMVATRQRLPRTPQARLHATARLASRLRGKDGHAPALALALHEAADGRWQDARIRLITDSRPRGLLRLDIALDDDDTAHGVLVTREKTEGEAQAAKLCGALAVRGPGGRVARVVRLDEALDLALRLRPEPPKRRRQRRPARPNQHRPRPATAPLH